MRMAAFFGIVLVLLTTSSFCWAHDPFDDIPPPFLVVEKIDREDPFRQLDDVLPTPNEARLASGAPGPGYWQQQVDMDIEVTLDAEAHRLVGVERGAQPVEPLDQRLVRLGARPLRPRRVASQHDVGVREAGAVAEQRLKATTAGHGTRPQQSERGRRGDGALERRTQLAITGPMIHGPPYCANSSQ